MVFLNFGIYAVLVTGLLHAELADYVLKPQDHIITTLIRIQCSLFPIFAFYLLNRWMPRQSDQALSWRASWGLFAGFSLAFTAFTLSVPSIKGFGWLTAASTIQAAPVFSLFFIVLAVALAVTALRRRASGTTYSSQRFTIFSLGCLLLGATPSLGFFIVLLIIMPLGLAWFWREPALRSAKL
jgi:hypothetical protein